MEIQLILFKILFCFQRRLNNKLTPGKKYKSEFNSNIMSNVKNKRYE